MSRHVRPRARTGLRPIHRRRRLGTILLLGLVAWGLVTLLPNVLGGDPDPSREAGQGGEGEASDGREGASANRASGKNGPSRQAGQSRQAGSTSPGSGESGKTAAPESRSGDGSDDDSELSSSATSPSPSPSPPCDVEEVAVTVRPARSVAPAGEPLDFAVEVSVESGDPCRLTVGPGELRLVVMTGSDRVWDTDLCPAVVPGDPIDLPAQKPGRVELAWNGINVAGACEQGEPSAAGSYYVQAAIGDELSEAARFTLR